MPVPKPTHPGPAHGVPKPAKTGPAQHAWKKPPAVTKPKPKGGVQ